MTGGDAVLRYAAPTAVSLRCLVVVVVLRLCSVFRGGRRRFVSFGLGRRMRMDFWRGEKTLAGWLALAEGGGVNRGRRADFMEGQQRASKTSCDARPNLVRCGYEVENRPGTRGIVAMRSRAGWAN